MPERFDHVIFADADLGRLEATCVQLGFTVVGGGTHPHLGTRNRIIVLGEGYLELLGIAAPDRASPVLQARIQDAESGWVGCAVQSDDIAAEAEAMRQRGADVRGPHAGRLVAPSGTARAWRNVTLGSDDLWAAAEPLPFLIQHEAIGAEHQAQLAGADTLTPHANGATALAEVALAVRDLDAMVARFAATYGVRPVGAPTKDALLGAEVLRLPLDQGRQHLTLARPSAPGYAAQRLSSAGEGVCAVGLLVANLAQTHAYLQAHSITHHHGGTYLRLGAADGTTAGQPPLWFVEATA